MGQPVNNHYRQPTSDDIAQETFLAVWSDGHHWQFAMTFQKASKDLEGLLLEPELRPAFSQLARTKVRFKRAILPILLVAASPLAHAQRWYFCSAATLNGTYATVISGQLATPTGPVAISGVAMTQLDGQGGRRH
jgi:hypothetical protein